MLVMGMNESFYPHLNYYLIPLTQKPSKKYLMSSLCSAKIKNYNQNLN